MSLPCPRVANELRAKADRLAFIAASERLVTDKIRREPEGYEVLAFISRLVDFEQYENRSAYWADFCRAYKNAVDYYDP